ncbi:MAG: CarD family transcriptional regulator, partial [Nocardioidaceae bacterium]
MSLKGLADLVLRDKVLASAVEDARDGAVPALDLTGPSALRPFVVKGLVDAGRTVLAVAATAREAEDLVTYLRDLVDPSTVAYYPAWETLPHERLSPRSDTVGTRLAVLRRLKHPGSDPSNGPVKVVVAPVRSILQPQVKGLADLEPVELAVGDEADLDDVVRRLAAAAYSRVDLVEKRGEFAVRGGIIDVFPPTLEHPVRVEFWGDEVEEIRSFSVADQRSLEPVSRLWAPPCRELLLTDEVRRRAAELGESHPELAEITHKLSEGHAVEGMESLAPVLVDEMEMLVDLMPERTHVLVLDPERARSRAHDLVATSEEFLHASWAAAAGGGQAPIDLGAASYRSLADVRARTLAQGKPWWSISPFGLDPDATQVSREPLRDELGEVVDAGVDVEAGAVESRTVKIRPVEAYRGDIEHAVTDMKQWLTNGSRVVLLNEGHGPAQRMAEVLKEHDVPARLVESLDAEPEPGLVHVSTACLDHGFVDDEQCLAVLTGDDLTGQRSSTKDMRRMPTRRKKQIDPLELKPGDYVVHEQHGVGRYVEMAQRTVQGATREYLVLEY